MYILLAAICPTKELPHNHQLVVDCIDVEARNDLALRIALFGLLGRLGDVDALERGHLSLRGYGQKRVFKERSIGGGVVPNLFVADDLDELSQVGLVAQCGLFDQSGPLAFA